MSFGLFPQEQNNALDAIQRMGPMAAPDPSFFAGSLTAAPLGAAEGVGKIGRVLGDIGAQNVSMTGIPTSTEFSDQTAPQYLAPLSEVTDEEQRQTRAQAVQHAIDYFKADPNTVGTAGQVLHSVSSIGVRALAGGAAAGPIGAAVAAGGTEGYSTYRELLPKTDENTARALASANALMTGIGVGTPLLSGVGGTLVKRAASGAVVNALFGAADRATMHTVLADNGYNAMAAQYRVLDGQALASDTILGAVFGGVGHFHTQAAISDNLVREMGVGSLFKPSDVDAAHVAADAAHIESSAEGVPTDPVSRANRIDNMTAAARALLNDEPVSDLKPVDTITNPAQEALQRAAVDAHTEAAREAIVEAGMGGEPPAFTGEERRGDVLADNRLAELSAKRNTEGLTPAETDEFAGLLDQRRLTTRVAGRTIQGVGSYDAYTEMLARGEGKPVVGFADADMLHATNEAHGYPVGDELIRTLGETLAHYFGEGNVFRRVSETGGSDEFITHTNTEAEHDANILAAQRYLENHTLRAYDKTTGALIGEKKGAGFSHGKGTDEASAAAATKLDKQRRADAQLRSDRGTVAEKPGAERGAGGSAETAGTKAGKVKTPTEAISKLSIALKRLVATDGKDANAHETARAILAHAAESKWDGDGIGRAAVERAGPGAADRLATATVRDQPVADTGGLDPTTRESVEQAQSVIDRRPNLSIPGADGVAVAGHDALNQALEGIAGAKQEGVLHQIAAACFGRG
jgi:GGDEF domain-containing protein